MGGGKIGTKVTAGLQPPLLALWGEAVGSDICMHETGQAYPAAIGRI